MTIKSRMIEEFSFTSEDNFAGACSSALRKVRSLADSAPIGRLFASIATLSDMSNQIGQSWPLTILPLPQHNEACKAKQLAETATPCRCIQAALKLELRATARRRAAVNVKSGR